MSPSVTAVVVAGVNHLVVGPLVQALDLFQQIVGSIRGSLPPVEEYLIMSDPALGTDHAGRRSKRFLSPLLKYEIFLQVGRQEAKIAEAAEQWQVDHGVIMRIRAVPRRGTRARLSPDRGEHRPGTSLLASDRDELIPAACHVSEQYANNPVEADHGHLKARLRPMRGLKRFRSARVISVGHTFVQPLRRGHYELGVDIDRRHRLLAAFTESPAPSDRGSTAENLVCFPPTVPELCSLFDELSKHEQIGAALTCLVEYTSVQIGDLRARLQTELRAWRDADSLDVVADPLATGPPPLYAIASALPCSSSAARAN